MGVKNWDLDVVPGRLPSESWEPGQNELFQTTPSRYVGIYGTPLQYSCLENPMDGEVWWATVHGVAKGQTRLSNFPFTFHFHELEKEMSTHSSVLAWRIPGMGEPGGLLSMGSHRVGHDWSDLVVVVVEAGQIHSTWSYYLGTSVLSLETDLVRWFLSLFTKQH